MHSLCYFVCLYRNIHFVVRTQSDTSRSLFIVFLAQVIFIKNFRAEMPPFSTKIERFQISALNQKDWNVFIMTYMVFCAIFCFSLFQFPASRPGIPESTILLKMLHTYMFPFIENNFGIIKHLSFDAPPLSWRLQSDSLKSCWPNRMSHHLVT